MKIYLLFFLLILFLPETRSQDIPSGYTTHYGLRKWAENAHPSSDSLNANWVDIDQALRDLIITTDGDMFRIENDSLKFSLAVVDTGEFSGTAETCTTSVANMKEGDVVTVTPLSANYDLDDMLRIVSIDNGSFIVGRNSSGGTSDLKFTYIWIKKR